MQTLNVGVIGLGMGQAHLKGYEACQEATVVAVCDIDREILDSVLKDRKGVEGYLDYKQMLSRHDLDAVSIALPNHLHAPVTLDALDAGKHVLCEKPMAMDADQARRMKQRAEEKGLTLMLHFNMRFMSSAATIRPLVDQGKIGHVYHAVTTYTRRDGYPKPGSWFGQKEKSGGGPLIDLGVHRLDLALWLMGHPRPQTVLSNTFSYHAEEKLANLKFDCEDFSSAFIRFEDGRTLYLTASWDAHQPTDTEQLMRLYGTRGSVFENTGDITYCSQIEGAPEGEVLEPRQPEESPQDHFVRSVLHDRDPGPSAEDGVLLMRILDAIYRSASTGDAVRID